MQRQDGKPHVAEGLRQMGTANSFMKMFDGALPTCWCRSTPGRDPNKSPLSVLNSTEFTQFYFWPILTVSKENVYADIAVKIERMSAPKGHLYPLALKHFYVPIIPMHLVHTLAARSEFPARFIMSPH